MLTDEEIMRQVLEAFQEEQAEHCQNIGDILLDLEHTPDHPQFEERVAQLFREAHSLKGGARAAGQEAVEQLAHRVEDLFSAVRQGHVQISSEVCDPVYTALEAIREMMQQVASGKQTSLEPYQPLMASLNSLLEEGTPEAAPAPEPTPAPEAAPAPEPKAPAPEPKAPAQPRPAANANANEEVPWEVANSTVRLSTATLDTLMNETGELIISAARSQQQSRDARSIAELPANWRRTWRQVNPIIKRLQEQQYAFQPTVHHLQDRIIDQRAKVLLGGDAHITSDTMLLLEALQQANRIIGDLEQRLGAHARRSGEDAARLSAVTGRMQDQIRRTRMLPLATLFSPLRVQLREMMRAAHKQVVLEADDGGAEADRQVLEGLREVLLHLLRNAVDHGIEPPDVRQARNKPETGRVTLKAVVSGEYLSLTVEDDGGGLNVEAITQRALAEGIVSESDLIRMGEADLIDLVFLPGFSTRQTVDKLSGRGVGLDIVRSNVERMHGHVSVQSTSGVGSLFSIRVPLSLTSSQGLLLRVGEATYMLPLESIQRIVPVAPRDIKVIEGHPALTLNGHPMTLIHLCDLLGETRHTAPDAHRRNNTEHDNVGGGQSLALLLGSGDRQVACMIDGVLGEQELVVHRLPAPLQRVRFIAGATILPDGQVVPILDLVDVLRAAIGARRMIDMRPEPEASDRTPTVVVADDSITTRTLEKNILEAAGYRVQLAIDGAEAFDVLHRLMENGGCDLLLSDIDMPNLNGFDLATQVRNDATLKHLPIVLVTSLDTAADRERGMAAGADAYIVKRAFDQQLLLDTIAQLI
jgi:two-component system chemotaxis sensor kinase CheA